MTEETGLDSCHSNPEDQPSLSPLKPSLSRRSVAYPWQRSTFIFPYECNLFCCMVSLNKCECVYVCVCVCVCLGMSSLTSSSHVMSAGHQEAPACHQPPPLVLSQLTVGAWTSSLMFNLQKLHVRVCLCVCWGVVGGFAQMNFSGMLVCTFVCSQRSSMLTHIPADVNIFTSRRIC